MAREVQGSAGRRVERVRAKIERWRGRRRRGSAMPEHLWAEAVELARGLGVYGVMRALGVNYLSLKKRVASATTKGNRGDFIELNGAQILGTPTGSVVELSDADGGHLIVRFATGSDLNVAVLIE